MRESNLPDKFQLGMFGQCGDGLGDSEHGTDDIVSRVTQGPVDIKWLELPIHRSKQICNIP